MSRIDVPSGAIKSKYISLKYSAAALTQTVIVSVKALNLVPEKPLIGISYIPKTNQNTSGGRIISFRIVI